MNFIIQKISSVDCFKNRYFQLGLLFLIALIPRAVCVWQIQHSVLADYLQLDAETYDQWGQFLASGQGGSANFAGMPLYAYFLGGLYRLFGHQLLAVRIVQIILGAMTCTATCLIAKKMSGSIRAGLGAFAVALLFRPAVFYEMFPLTESLCAFLCACLLLLLLNVGEKSRFIKMFFAGILAGFGVALRVNFCAVLFALALWIFFNFQRPRVKILLSFLIGAAFILVPFAIQNQSSGKNSFFSGYNPGISFFLGNGPQADGRFPRFPVTLFTGDMDLPQIMRHAAESRTGKHLTERELSSFWFHEAFNHIQRHPGQFARLLFSKMRLLVSGFEMPDIFSVPFLTPFVPVLYLLPLNFFWLLPLAFAGMAICFASDKQQKLLALFFAFYAATIVAILVHERYKIPLYPLLAVYAACGINGFFKKEMPRWRKIAALGIFLLLLVASTDKLFIKPYEVSPYAGYQLLGRHYLGKGRFPEAVAMLRKYVETAPASRIVDAHNSLGIALDRNHQWKEAEREYLAASKLDPSYPFARVNLQRMRTELQVRIEDAFGKVKLKK